MHAPNTWAPVVGPWRKSISELSRMGLELMCPNCSDPDRRVGDFLSNANHTKAVHKNPNKICRQA